ncbi:hypothetical protein TCAL_10197 [Tigriopus californicus]|uniref:RRM domain-containing protein n=1 Tax=Tigriopus californicus TaxID=6832 RepID=A0A553PHY1_TIGCA|nr:heterogeneous nuclear ribonucleoprotein Q-like isoform X1 [Tigriopus californicus]TRY77284.1 hypothetical protein TCAL_10197 [Tigriopus californicus]
MSDLTEVSKDSPGCESPLSPANGEAASPPKGTAPPSAGPTALASPLITPHHNNNHPHKNGPGSDPPAERTPERTPDHEQLLQYGLDPKVADRLDDIYKTGKLQHSDLDDRALDALKEFPTEGALAVLAQFLESNLGHVSNKSAFLCGVMKTYRQKTRAAAGVVGVAGGPPGVALAAGDALHDLNGASSPASLANTRGPDEDKINAILERTGYALDVTTGQRKYGGPPPGWEGNPPGQGCEVFCGKIPRDLFEDDLIPLFEKCGIIWDLRLMMDPMTGSNRGYAFITFTTRDAANEAVRQLNDFELRKGKKIGVTISFNNHRLFVGNIPKNRDREELLEEFSKHAPGLREVIIYSSPDDKKKNRGFCFLEYESHKAASLAKRRLETSRVKVWSCDIIVDWADPQEEPDQETMSKVKVLYVRNLTVNVTEERLRELFEAHGRVERVKKIKDYAFVHFEERKQAVAALKELHGSDLAGAQLEISLAKPPSDKKKKEDMLRKRDQRMMKNIAHTMTLPPFPPFHNPYGPMGGPPVGIYGRGGGRGGHHMGNGIPRGMPRYDPANWFAGYYNWNWGGEGWPAAGGRSGNGGSGMAPWMGGSHDQWGGGPHQTRSGNHGHQNFHHHHHHGGGSGGNGGSSYWGNSTNLGSNGGANGHSNARRGGAGGGKAKS